MIGRWLAGRLKRKSRGSEMGGYPGEVYDAMRPPLRTTKFFRPALLRFPAVTSEEYMRTIAREEIAAREAEQNAANYATLQKWFEEHP